MSLNYSRDPQLFLHLWKYKVGSTRSLQKACFPTASLGTTYSRLIKLNRGTYIRRILFDGKGGLWTLAVNGFKEIKSEMVELEQNGYGSESPLHDRLVAMIAHEDYWPSLPPGWEFLSDEEIKRIPIDLLPCWYPSLLMRRPDGLWHIDQSKEIFALEVETSLKGSLSYKAVADQYQDVPAINRVFWFVTSQKNAKAILEAIVSRVGSECLKHSFILISDFIQSGWRARIICGCGTGLSFEKLSNLNDGRASMTSLRLSHLDTSFCPQKSAIYSKISDRQISNSTQYAIHSPFAKFLHQEFT